LLCDENVPVEELYPLGTWVECLDPATNMLLAGMVMDIPLSTAPSGSTLYQVLFDNGTLAFIQLAEMASLIPAPPLLASSPTDSSSDGSSSLLPPFFSINSQITYEYEGAYHKGFLTQKPCGTY
jgi:hypothetical protein